MELNVSHTNRCKCKGEQRSSGAAPGVTHTCGCDKFKGNISQSSIVANSSRHEMFMGRDHLVVPVVMIKSDVVMNGLLVPASEIQPHTWNGVPVTVRHPASEEGSISANSPETLTQYAVGQIFNAVWDQGNLKGEAWIDVDRANSIYPGIIETLEAGAPMDVSTGYFSDDEKQTGVMGGKRYTAISRNLNPDHLALLPDQVGACSWQDGCGVRANAKDGDMADDSKEEEKVSITTLGRLLDTLGIKPKLKGNERGDDEDDYRLMVADLISSDETPFVPDDEQSLRMFTFDTLKKMRDLFVPKDKEVKDNSSKEGSQDMADDKEKDKGLVTMSEEKLNELITNAVASALKDHKPALSADDTAALTAAKEIVANARKELVATITANSDMTEDQLKTMDDTTLKTIAAGLRKPKVEAFADFSARPVPIVNTDKDKPDKAVAAMVPPKLSDRLSANRKQKELN